MAPVADGPHGRARRALLPCPQPAARASGLVPRATPRVAGMPPGGQWLRTVRTSGLARLAGRGWLPRHPVPTSRSFPRRRLRQAPMLVAPRRWQPSPRGFPAPAPLEHRPPAARTMATGSPSQARGDGSVPTTRARQPTAPAPVAGELAAAGPSRSSRHGNPGLRSLTATGGGEATAGCSYSGG